VSEIERAETEARKWMREHNEPPPNSLYWRNVLTERDRLTVTLAAVEEQLAQRDARIAELERAPVVVESDEARRLRDAWGALTEREQSAMLSGWTHERAAFSDAVRAFCKSAPPASAPAPAERVTVYAIRRADGSVAAALYSECERRNISLRPDNSWLAIDARVVAEGGA